MSAPWLWGTCPECGHASQVAEVEQAGVEPGHLWWAGEDGRANLEAVGCPYCGEVVCVDNECEINTSPLWRRLDRLGLLVIAETWLTTMGGLNLVVTSKHGGWSWTVLDPKGDKLVAHGDVYRGPVALEDAKAIAECIATAAAGRLEQRGCLCSAWPRQEAETALTLPAVGESCKVEIPAG